MSNNNQTTIDISTKFEEMLLKNTSMNVFSEDISNILIEFETWKNEEEKTQTISLGQAIFRNASDMIGQIGVRRINPFNF